MTGAISRMHEVLPVGRARVEGAALERQLLLDFGAHRIAIGHHVPIEHHIAGADEGLIPQWAAEGRRRAQAARQPPHGGRPA